MVVTVVDPGPDEKRRNSIIIHTPARVALVEQPLPQGLRLRCDASEQCD